MKRLYHTYYLMIIASIVMIVSCSEGLNETIVVHEDLQVFFANFEEEGQQRGIEIDLLQAEIQAYMEDIEENGIVGQCVESEANGNSIIVDSERWRRLSNFEKEFIVFHELGHCFLGRSHTNEKTRTGTCLSIMHSSTNACNIQYDETTREDYLDELFFN